MPKFGVVVFVRGSTRVRPLLRHMLRNGRARGEASAAKAHQRPQGGGGLILEAAVNVKDFIQHTDRTTDSLGDAKGMTRRKEPSDCGGSGQDIRWNATNEHARAAVEWARATGQ